MYSNDALTGLRWILSADFELEWIELDATTTSSSTLVKVDCPDNFEKVPAKEIYRVNKSYMYTRTGMYCRCTCLKFETYSILSAL